MPIEPNGERSPAAATLAVPLVAVPFFPRLMIAKVLSRTWTDGAADTTAQKEMRDTRRRLLSMVARID